MGEADRLVTEKKANRNAWKRRWNTPVDVMSDNMDKARGVKVRDGRIDTEGGQ